MGDLRCTSTEATERHSLAIGKYPRRGKTLSMPHAVAFLQFLPAFCRQICHISVLVIAGRDASHAVTTTPTTVAGTVKRTQGTAGMEVDDAHSLENEGVVRVPQAHQDFPSLLWKPGVELPPFVESNEAAMQLLAGLRPLPPRPRPSPTARSRSTSAPQPPPRPPSRRPSAVNAHGSTWSASAARPRATRWWSSC